MSVTLSTEKNDLIATIAKCQGSGEYEVEVKSGSMKGDGYLGIINTIHISYNSTPDKDLDLIIKSALTGEELREHTPIKKAYERESYMYKTVFPELTQFSEENGIKNKFAETAKYYASLLTDKEECIILENLKEKKFQMWNRKLPMNEEHMALVFATYGKFHGTSLALKYLRPEKFEEMSKNLRFIFHSEETTEAEKKKFEENAQEVFGNGFKAVADDKKASQALLRFVQIAPKFFGVDVRKIDKYSTILHGDCWCNNMMFNYSDTKNPSKPTEMCLLDWQLAHVGSPILDISYFFYTSSSKELLYNLKKFLKIYHDSFAKTIKAAGLSPDEVFTYEELETEWKTYSKYGLFMALFVMRVVLGDPEDAPDLNKLAKSGKHNIFTSLSDSESNIEQVNKRIADVINFMDEHDYL